MIRTVRTVISDVVEGAIKRFSGAGRKNEQFAGREYFQHYGFSSRPKPGAEGLAIVQGNTIHLIATEDRRYRISLQEGEVALYDDQGSAVHLKRGGVIRIAAPGTVEIEAAQQVTVEAAQQVTIEGAAVNITAQTAAITAPAATINGNLQVNGNINTTGSITLTTGTVINAAGDVLHHH